jgi:hypothetical protein
MDHKPTALDGIKSLLLRQPIDPRVVAKSRWGSGAQRRPRSSDQPMVDRLRDQPRRA